MSPDGILNHTLLIWSARALIVIVCAVFAWVVIGGVVGAVRWVWMALRYGDTDGAFVWWFCFKWAENIPQKMHVWWEKRKP